MSLIDIGGPIPWPSPPLGASGAVSTSTHTLDVIGEKIACICQVPKAGTISKIVFRTRTVATGGTIGCRIEGVNSSGEPDGALVSTGVEDTSVVIANGDDHILKTATLGTAWTEANGCVAGAFVAVVWTAPTSGTFDIDLAGFGDAPGIDLPYIGLFDTTNWTLVAAPSIFGFEYSDGSFAEIPGTFLFEDVVTYAYNLDSTPDEVGNRIQVPFTGRCCGAWVWMDYEADFDLKLYDIDDTLLEERAIVAAVRHDTNGTLHYYRWADPVTLNVDEWYRLTVAPSGTTPNLTIYGTEVVGVPARLDTHPGGQRRYATQRTGGGTWSDATSNMYFNGLLFDQLSTGYGVRRRQITL